MIVILMGVSGSGKTTIGKLLAQRLGAHFLDADDFHPEDNVKKMRSGIALDDADRTPWLEQLKTELRNHEARGDSVVLACSALKRSYRDQLRQGLGDVRVVYLHGTKALLATRLAGREGHYMPPTLLDSQLETLEEPRNAITIDVSGTPEGATEAICQLLEAGSART
ncbi:MAG TPA: gluconokinase [Burkholderiales bacterium]